MRFTKLSLLALICVTGPAFANEHGGGGAAAPAPVPRDQKEYLEKTIKLSSLASKLEESEKQFAEVVHEKNEAATPEAKLPYLKEMVEIAKQRNTNVHEYNKVKTDLALRYPNQGEHLNRHFRRHDAHSAEELEHEIAAGPSLDELLIETKRMIDQKYAPFNPPRADDARRPAAVTAPAPPKPPRLRLER